MLFVVFYVYVWLVCCCLVVILFVLSMKCVFCLFLFVLSCFGFSRSCLFCVVLSFVASVLVLRCSPFFVVCCVVCVICFDVFLLLCYVACCFNEIYTEKTSIILDVYFVCVRLVFVFLFLLAVILFGLSYCCCLCYHVASLFAVFISFVFVLMCFCLLWY